MKSSRLHRVVFALTLTLSLLSTPLLSVYAQQPVRKQVVALETKSSDISSAQVKGEKKTLAGGGLIPLSDEEMEKIQGGNPFAIAIGLAALGFAGYTYVQNRRAHRELLKACRR